jgi:hypothetical protein
MSALALSGIVFAVVFSGALLGMALHGRLPDHHLSDSSKEIVRLVMGLVATIAALVLGLLIASAKGAYDTQSGNVTQLSAQIVQLDRMLQLYGPETSDIRREFHDVVEQAVDRAWPSDAHSANVALSTNRTAWLDFVALIAKLDPGNTAQRFAQARALDIAASLSQTRILMFEQSGSAISPPFLSVLVFWLIVLFLAFGLYAPPNATVIAAMFVGALSVAGALFLILELDQPYEGLLQLSPEPLRAALARIAS